MTSVDERIVAMYLDNKNFEKNAKKTLDTLEKLRSGMDFEGSAKGLNEMNSVMNQLSFDKTTQNSNKFSESLSTIQSVAKKTFSAATFPLRKLGEGIGSLARQVKQWAGIDLARSLEQAGLSFARSLTIAPLSTGWNEYEMKMDSIRTIMEGSGESLEVVKARLEQLNRYADETIYSFKDMTSNIGKFTNAGVKLETATRSIMGISNLAAKAGQGAQQASMAMYNFSQSMAMGYVELRDWRSIENANMATLEFKQTLIDTAVAMGTLKKDAKGVVRVGKSGKKKSKGAEVTAENLRETLKNKWLTGDVLNATLELYSGELTSWQDVVSAGLISKKDEKGRTKSEKQLRQEAEDLLAIGIAAKEAAKEVRTFDKMYDALKEAAQSGWAMTWEYIIGDLNEAKQLWTNINEWLSGRIQASEEVRNNMLLTWRGLAKMEDGTLQKIGNYGDQRIDGREVLLTGLQRIVNMVEDVTEAIKLAWQSVFGTISGSDLLEWTIQFEAFTQKMSDWLGTLDDPESRLSKIFRIASGIFSALKVGITIMRRIGKIALNAIKPLIDPLLNVAAYIGDVLTLLGDIFTVFDQTSDWQTLGVSLVALFANVFLDLRDTVGSLWTKFKAWVHKLFYGEDIIEFDSILDNGKIALQGVEKHVKGVFEDLRKSIEWGIDYVKSGKAFEDLGTWFGDRWKELRRIILGSEGFIFEGENAGKVSRTPFGQLVYDFEQDINKVVSELENNETFKTISEVFGNIYTQIGSFFEEKEIDNGDGAVQKLPSDFAILTAKIVRSIKSLPETVSSAFEDVKKSISENETVQQIGAALQKAFDEVFKFFTDTENEDGITGFQFFTENLSGSIGDFETEVVGVWTSVSNWFTQANTDVRQFIDDAKAWEGWQTIGAWFKDAKTNVSDFITKIQGWASAGWIDVQNWFAQANTDVTGFVNNARSWEGWNVIGTWFSGLWTELQNIGEQLRSGKVWDDIKAFFVGSEIDNGDGIVQKLPSGLQMLGVQLARAFGTFKSNVEPAWTTVTDWFNHVIESVNEFADKIRNWSGWDAIREFFLGKDVLVDMGPGDTRVFHEKGPFVQFFDNLIEAINTKIDELKQSEIYQKVSGFLTEMWNNVIGFFTDTDNEDGMTGFQLFVENFVGTLNEWYQEIQENPAYQAAKTLFDRLWTIVSDFFTKTDETTGETPFSQFINGLGDDITNFINDVQKMTTLDSLLTTLTGLWDRLVAFTGLSNETGTSSGGAVASGKSPVQQAAEVLTQASTDLGVLSGPAEGTLESMKQTADTCTRLATSVQEKLDEFSATVGGWNISEEVQKIWDSIVGFFEGLKADVHTVLVGSKEGEKASVATVESTDFFERIIGSITEFVESVKSVGTKTWNKISTFFTNLNDKVIQPLTHIVEVILEHAAKNPDTVLVFLYIYKWMDTVGSVAKAVRKTNLATALNSASLKILEIAAALWLVGDIIDRFGEHGLDEKFWRGVGAVAAIGLVFILLYGAFKTVGAWTDNLFKVTKETADGTEKLGKAGILVEDLVSQLIKWAGIFVIMKYAVPDIVKAMSALKGVDFGAVVGACLGIVILAGGLLMLSSLSDKLGVAGLKGSMYIIGMLAIVLGGIALIADMAVASNWETKFKSLGKAIGNLIGGVSAGRLETGAEGMANAANTLRGITEDDVKHVQNLMGIFNAISEAMPHNDTTVWELLLGENKFDYFANNMEKMGEGLRAFDNALSGSNSWAAQHGGEVLGIDIDRVRVGAEALEILAKTARLFNDGQVSDFSDFFSWFEWNSENDLSSFDYGPIMQFFGGIGTAINEGLDDTAKIINTKSITDAIANGILADKIAISQALQEAYRYSTNHVSLDTSTNTLTTGIESGATNIFSGLTDSVTNLEKELDPNNKDGLLGQVTALTSAFSGQSDQLVASLSSGMNNFQFKGDELNGWITNFTSQLMPEASDYTSEAKQLVMDLSTEISGYSSDMESAGKNLDIGLSNGIWKYAYVPVSTMSAVAARVVSAAESQFDIGSPSKVFSQIGRFNMEGLANGTASYGDRAVSAVHTMGEQYLNEIKQAFDPLGTWMNDTQQGPVIRPVLDMSEVRSGLSGMPGMFGSYSLGASIPGYGRSVSMPNVSSGSVNAQFGQTISDKLDELNANITNLQVVLDSGAVVGGIGPAMDRYLGQQANRYRRGR